MLFNQIKFNSQQIYSKFEFKLNIIHMEDSVLKDSIIDNDAQQKIKDITKILADHFLKIQTEWKSKSLDSYNPQKYTIQYSNIVQQTSKIVQKNSPKKKGKEPQQDHSLPMGRKLPEPRVRKLNNKLFCIYLNRQIWVFYQRIIETKIKGKSFNSFQFKVPSDIIQIEGTADNQMFIACDNNIIIAQIQLIQGNYKITGQKTLQVPGIKIMLVQDSSKIYAVSNEKIYEFGNKKGNTQILAQHDIKLRQGESELHTQIFNELQACDLVIQDNSNLFFFGTKTQQKTRVEISQMQTKQNQVKVQKCEILTVVHFDLDRPLIGDTPSPKNGQKNAIGSAYMKTYPVDFIFETGLFARAKTYVIQDSMFLMGLYEEVILIKKHFDKYIVWDNVSIISSKGQTRKGQLVLSDRRFLVYSENDQIYAFDIYFNFTQAKLEMPPIDSFKGTDNQQQQLYDSVLLQLRPNTMMNVLFYFRTSEIKLPNGHDYALGTDDRSPAQQNILHFSIVSITQSDPKEKLLWLIENKKPNNVINDFVRRFNITPQQKKKGTWMVSQKGIKDIQHILEQISDDKFIEQQLDKILKSKPHDLNFLIIVQRKKIERLKKTLVSRLLHPGTGGFQQMENKKNQLVTQTSEESENGQQNQKKEIQYINQNIRWLMESIMFEKKLIYSQKFLSFKQYDFIEISKLKAASLKQQIKLLSAKKFEKRLHYFLNSFKYLAIANFEQIFNFLLENKSIKQLRQFLKSYRFIIPGFIQSSNVFIKKNKTKNIFKNITTAITDLASEQRCTLWDQFRDLNQQMLPQEIMKASIQMSGIEKKQEKFNNIQNFEKQIIQLIEIASGKNKQVQLKNKALEKFKKMLSRFTDCSWFRNSAFKQHSMLSITTQDLYNRFYELKNEGVFKLLVKFLYKRVSEGFYKLEDVEYLLDDFVSQGLISESFRRNVQARLEVYQYLQNQLKDSKMIGSRDTFPLRQRFLIMSEEEYFEHLFLYHRQLILRQIKSIYDKIDAQFFRERFSVYLNSLRCTIKQLIQFLDEFENPSTDEIRMDLFKCLKKYLKLSDYNNAKKFTEKSLDKQIFPENRQFDAMALKEQAKIPYAFYFYYFFKALKVDFTYDQFIKFTNLPYLKGCTIIISLMDNYCEGNMVLDEGERCIISFEGDLTMDTIQDIDITESPLNFFSILLFLLDTLDFKIPFIDVFINFVQNYLNNDQFEILHHFISSLESFDQVGPTIIHNDILMEFKVNNDITKTLSQTILLWVRSQLDAITNADEVQMIFEGISNALQLLKDFSRQSQVERQRAFFEMLKLIKNFDPALLVSIETLRGQLQMDGFQFMINLMHKGNLQIFDQFATEVIEDLIYNFYCIYCQFKQASTGQIVNSTQSIELQKFYIDLCVSLISKRYYHSALRVLHRVMSGTLYHRDLILLFIGSMNKSQINEDQLERLVKDIMETESPALVKRKFTAIADMAGQFLPHQQAQNSIFEVFKTMLNIYKYDQAFYCLIKLPWLNLIDAQVYVQESTTPKKQLAQHLVLTAFIRCLHQHLSKKFYPSFDFYKAKHSLLTSDYDRHGMIKDFNIALSRLQDVLDGRDRPYQEEQKRYNQHDSAISQVDEQAIRDSIEELQYYYKLYMKTIQMDPYIKLTSEDYKDHAVRIQKYARQIRPQELKEVTESKKQQIQVRSALHDNTKKVADLNKSNRVKVIEKDIAQSISEAKQTAQKYQKLIKERRENSPKRVQYPSDLKQLNRKEKQQLQSIKDSFKSNTTQRVNELIENLKKKRNKAIEESRVHIAEQAENQKRLFTSSRKQFRPPSVVIDKYLKKDNKKPDEIVPVSLANQAKQKTTARKQDQSPINKMREVKQQSKNAMVSLRKQEIRRQTQRQKQKIRYQAEQLEKKRKERRQVAQREHERLNKKKQQQKQRELQKQERMRQEQKRRKEEYQERQQQRRKIMQSEKKKMQQARQNAMQKQEQRKKKQAKRQEQLRKLEQSKKVRKDKKQQTLMGSISQKGLQIGRSLRKRPSIVANEDSLDHTSSFSGASQYIVRVHSPKSESEQQSKKSDNSINNFIPVTMQEKKRISVHDIDQQGGSSNIISGSVSMAKNKQPFYYGSVRGQLEQSRKQKKTRRNSPDRIKKLSFTDIVQLFESSEPQAKKYLPKLDMIKNNIKVGEQLAKRIYNVTRHFQSFYKFLCFLINHDQRYKDIIEEKALVIVSQMIKMDISLNFKMLFPLDFFLNVCPIPQKDYYPIAFDIIRPHLIKILTPESNIHAIAIMFCYGFGTDKLYSYKVYEDYGRVLMKDFAIGPLDHRKLYLYTEKIRNLYSNLNPADRSNKLKQIVNQITNPDKRNTFIAGLGDMLEKRSQSMSLGASSQQFFRNVEALAKNVR